ncbi:cobalt ABC transporter, inner membrane subunit CbiQ [Methanobacterium lacus]|uniref:Cobalt ABC transporter, inner membrane subunit CbiQ n=1 Tax=Methanobacterium lacus (strain AL-21) TaxID=877455 RepID=F0TAX9_METLA|nr:cobalt ECF transporter T component CbiQ [Methanobacterium lacus]ADZ09005.1 cobalt ABC transporter, inner membrane subunit CbiQ [Methanobacterium lacus]
MFELTLDGYAHSNELRNLNPYFKVLFAIITMIVSLISTSPVVPLFIFLFFTFLILFEAKIPIKFYLKFLLVPLTFAFITFVFMAIFFGYGQYVYDLGFLNLGVSADGFNRAALVFARIMGGFACLAFLALTTPMTELFAILEAIKIPKIVVELTMLMYRYIFLFLDEAVNMYHSQETRNGYSTMKKSYKSMGMLISNLFIKTWLKGEQTFIAMESRCYDGSIKTMNDFGSVKTIGIKKFSFLIMFEIVLCAAVYFSAGFHIL